MVVAFAALAAAGAWWNLNTVAIGWDAAEYVWVARANLMPHSPYLGYVLLARLLGLFLPVGLGLALASLASFVGTVLILPEMLRRLSIRPRAALFATGLFAGYPVCLHHAGIQEIYCVELFLVVLSLRLLVARTRHHLLWSGVVFGLATSVHHGTLFVLPCFVLLLFFGLEREGGLGAALGRLSRWGAPAAAIGGASLLASWLMFRAVAPAHLGFAEYLRSIGTWARERTPLAFLQSAGNELRRIFSPGIVGLPVATAALAALGLLATLRRPVAGLLPWIGFGGAYALFEALVGRNVDRGLYVAYAALPAAVLAGVGLDALVRLVSRVPIRLLRDLSVATGWGFVLLAFAVGIHVAQRSHPSLELEMARNLPAWRASEWIERHLPADAVVVEPRGIDNMNLLPSIHLRRPILWYRGGYRWMEPYRRWAPVHPALFEPLSYERLAGVLREGALVVALDRALGDFDPRIALEPLEGFGAEVDPPPQRLFRLALRADVAGGGISASAGPSSTR